MAYNVFSSDWALLPLLQNKLLQTKAKAKTNKSYANPSKLPSSRKVVG